MVVDAVVVDVDVAVVVVVDGVVVVVVHESTQDEQSQKLLQRIRKSGKETERKKNLSGPKLSDPI